MGNLLSGFFNRKKETRILMVGLDAAGKTAILYKLRLGENVTTIPTIGFNVEQVTYKNLNFNIWDIGGQDVLRPLWKYYYSNSDAIIYVVDSNDKERFEESRTVLNTLLDDDLLKGLPLLVLANKHDLPQSQPVSTICKSLQLTTIANREWFCQSCCALNGDGLYEGLDWLSKRMK